MYVEPGEPDHDTGTDYSADDQNKGIAWGGTTSDDPQTAPRVASARLVLCILSAGPEYWTVNWDLTDADLDGDGVSDYRMPPVWEYGNLSGYRPFTDLSGDLATITRFVAINLLFTASPIYDPALSPPKLPRNIQLDINVYRVDQTVDPHSLINDADITSKKLGRLQPYNVVTSDTKEVPYREDSERTFNCWASFQPCYGGRQFSDVWFGGDVPLSPGSPESVFGGRRRLRGSDLCLYKPSSIRLFLCGEGLQTITGLMAHSHLSIYFSRNLGQTLVLG